MRFKNVKHAEYKILHHLMRRGSNPLSDVMESGIPGYNEYNGVTDKTDKIALKRFTDACDNLTSVLKNMAEKREKYVPEDDLD